MKRARQASCSRVCLGVAIKSPPSEVHDRSETLQGAAFTPLTEQQVAALRAATPGCQDLIHVNNAGAALPSDATVQTVVDHLHLEARLGGYRARAEAAQDYAALYDRLQCLLNAPAGTLALTESATRAWDIAFYGFPLKPGDLVVTGPGEYSSNRLAMLHRAKRDGIALTVLPADETGSVCLEALTRALDPPLGEGQRPALLALTHAPSDNGLVIPVAKAGRLAKAAGVPFLLDACQSAGQLPLDVEALACDFLAGTARKFLRGPRGVGFLYVAPPWLERLDPPFVDYFSAEWEEDGFALAPGAQRFESYEGPIAARLGFGQALAEALALGLPAICHRINHLAQGLRDGLEQIDGVSLQDRGVTQSGIVSFAFEGLTDHSGLFARAAEAGINFGLITRPPGQLREEPRLTASALRASLHVYNTEAEVARTLDWLAAQR